MTFSKLIITGVIASTMFAFSGLVSAAEKNAAVIEVATFQLKQGVTPAEFAVVDKAMENDTLLSNTVLLSAKAQWDQITNG